jgi:DNA replication and repair protein RecF
MGAQAIMTGTDPDLFDSLGNRAQTFAVADEGGESRISEVAI